MARWWPLLVSSEPTGETVRRICCDLGVMVALDFAQNPGKVMDDITFVRSHWWLVSEGFSL